jgi:hypothetical protein
MKSLCFLNPIDGDMLNERDGMAAGSSLFVQVMVAADPEHEITVNGKTAAGSAGIYTAQVELDQYSNRIEAIDKTSGTSEAIIVYRLLNYTGKYRLSLDDNIWFLRDIAKNAAGCKSIFENPYLGFYKQIHDEFGTKVHFNIYYQTEGFDLSQMPDKYKPEWRDNADWLRLSFHALQDTPDMPYISAGYDEMKRDCGKVQEQIIRFAGEEVLGPVTTLHWGEATVEGCRALRDLGYKCQVGDFNVDNDLPAVSYYLDVEKRRHINKRFIWKDNREDIIFFRSAIIIDCQKLENIAGFLDNIHADPQKSGYMDLLIHEQYFYPDYVNYQSNYRDKVRTSVKWAVEKGYKPEFLERCVFE